MQSTIRSMAFVATGLALLVAAFGVTATLSRAADDVAAATPAAGASAAVGAAQQTTTPPIGVAPQPAITAPVAGPAAAGTAAGPTTAPAAGVAIGQSSIAPTGAALSASSPAAASKPEITAGAPPAGAPPAPIIVHHFVNVVRVPEHPQDRDYRTELLLFAGGHFELILPKMPVCWLGHCSVAMAAPVHGKWTFHGDKLTLEFEDGHADFGRIFAVAAGPRLHLDEQIWDLVLPPAK